MSASLEVRDDGPVRVLTMRRPPGNALDIPLLSAIERAAVDAASAPGVRALILAGGVPRYFSSGLDLDALMSLPEPRRREPFERMIAAYRALLRVPQPTIAAMDGAAILGGWILAMACDFRVLAEGGKIALSEVRVGLSPTPAFVGRLSALSRDPLVVKDMVLRGKTLRAPEAAAAGLVDELAPDEAVDAAAMSLAKKLAKSPPRAYAAIKASVQKDANDEALWARALAEFNEIFAGAEAQEGMAAMRDKRRPRWEKE